MNVKIRTENALGLKYIKTSKSKVISKIIIFCTKLYLKLTSQIFWKLVEIHSSMFE